MVYRDRHIKRVLELGRNANIAIFSVGTVRDNALFFRLGYAEARKGLPPRTTPSAYLLPLLRQKTEISPSQGAERPHRRYRPR